MNKRAGLSIILAGALWGTTGIFINNMSASGLSAMQIACTRLVFSAVIFSVIALIINPSLFKIRLKDIWVFIGTGFIGVVLFNYFYFNTIILGETSVAVVLLYTSPVFVMIASAIFFRERITPIKIGAVLLTVLGCVLVCGLIGGSYKITAKVLGFGICSGFFYALYSVFGKVASQKYHTLTVTAYTFIFAGIGSLPFTDIVGTVSAYAASPVLLLWAVGITLTCTVLPYFFYTVGLKSVESGKASIMVSVETVVASAIGMIFFGDSSDVFKIVGIVLIVTAIVLLNITIPLKNKKEKTNG